MRLQDVIQTIFTNMIQQHRRLIPIILGVTFSTTLLFIVLISGFTVSSIISQQILGQGSLRQIEVDTNNSNELTTQNGSGIPTLNDEQIRSWVSIPHVVAAYPNVQVNITANTLDMGLFLSIANEPDMIVRPQLLEGTWPQTGQIALASAGIRNKLDQTIDSFSLVGQTIILNIPTRQSLISVNTVKVTVSGIFQAMPYSINQISALSPLPFVKNLEVLSYGKALTSYQTATIIADSPNNVISIANAVNQQGFVTTDIESQLAGFNQRLQGMIKIGIAISIFIFIMVTLSIVNLLVHSIQSRQREIGIMLAMGFTVRSIGQIITGEAIGIGILGTFGGTIVSTIILIVMRFAQPNIAIAIPWLICGTVIFVAPVLCAVVGIIPARQAMKIDVIRALREE